MVASTLAFEYQIELHAVLVADDGDIVPLGSVRQGEPEHPVKGERAIEITHADADMIDPLDCDGLGNCELPASVNTGGLYKVGMVERPEPADENWRSAPGVVNRQQLENGIARYQIGKGRHRRVPCRSRYR